MNLALLFACLLFDLFVFVMSNNTKSREFSSTFSHRKIFVFGSFHTPRTHLFPFWENKKNFRICQKLPIKTLQKKTMATITTRCFLPTLAHVIQDMLGKRSSRWSSKQVVGNIEAVEFFFIKLNANVATVGPFHFQSGCLLHHLDCFVSRLQQPRAQSRQRKSLVMESNCTAMQALLKFIFKIVLKLF